MQDAGNEESRTVDGSSVSPHSRPVSAWVLIVIAALALVLYDLRVYYVAFMNEREIESLVRPGMSWPAVTRSVSARGYDAHVVTARNLGLIFAKNRSSRIIYIIHSIVDYFSPQMADEVLNNIHPDFNYGFELDTTGTVLRRLP